MIRNVSGSRDEPTILEWMVRAPRKTIKPKRSRRSARVIEPRTPAVITALVGAIFGAAVAVCAVGMYQLLNNQELNRPYHSVVLMPSHTPTPAPRPPGWRQVSTYSIPILMYHHIRPLPTNGDRMGRGLSVSPETFAHQLDYLTANGYTPVTFAQLREGILPPKPVILTFDDGPADSYTNAFPALQARGLSGVFYIVSGFVDRSGYVTWDQIREMQRAGMEIGAHSIDHPDLAIASEREQQHQIAGSITAIQEALGQPVITFAYPAGKSSPDTVRLVEQAGVLYSVTTALGNASNTDNPQLLPRQRITDTTDFSILLP